MAKEYGDVFVFAGAYSNQDDAWADYEAIAELHRADWIGRYQSAIFEKTGEDNINVLDTTSTTRATGAKWGTAVGAVMGLIFPPSILIGAAAGAGAGAVAGNIAKGWFSGDIKEIGEALSVGAVGVVVVAEATPDVGAEKLLKRAVKTQKRMIDADSAAAKDELDHLVTA